MPFWEMLTINLLSHWGMRMCWVFFFTRKGIVLKTDFCQLYHETCKQFSQSLIPFRSITLHHPTSKGPKMTKQKSFSKKWYIHIMPNCFTNYLVMTNIIPAWMWPEGFFCWLNEVINYLLWLKTHFDNIWPIEWFTRDAIFKQFLFAA